MLHLIENLKRAFAHYMLNKVVAVHFFCRKCPQERFCQVEFEKIEKVLKKIVEAPASDLLKEDLNFKEWED